MWSWLEGDILKKKSLKSRSLWMVIPIRSQSQSPKITKNHINTLHSQSNDRRSYGIYIYFLEFAKLLGGPGPPGPLNTLPKCDPKSHYYCHLSHFWQNNILKELWSWNVKKKKDRSQQESKACHIFLSRSPISAQYWSKRASPRNLTTNTNWGAHVNIAI